MKPEKEQLLHDLLDGGSRRDATLLAGTRILRRRRQWRAAQRLLGLIALAAVVALFVERQTSPRRPALARNQSPAPVAKPSAAPAESPVKVLTDTQLLALFPNTPVGLATLPNGKKRLIFPHPGDEARFVTRL